jgi:hypothetical protein
MAVVRQVTGGPDRRGNATLLVVPALPILDAMAPGIITTSPLFKLAASTHVGIDALTTYDLVSDLRRSHLWSPECRGGVWISGDPRAVGSVFRGENYRALEVVGWAPLVRGTWYTDTQVAVADRGRSFQWAMRTHTGEHQKSVWGFDLAPAPGGCLLTHHFEMTVATEGIHHIVADLSEVDRVRFVVEWAAKLAGDLDVTLTRIKQVLEVRVLEVNECPTDTVVVHEEIG